MKDFWSMWSPHHWSVWVRCPPLGHTQTTQCSIWPMALSSCTVKIQVKLSVQLCSITDWQHRSDRCSVAIYTESDEFSWHATATISKVCFNIIHLIYDYIHMPFRFSDKNFVGNFHFSEMSHIQHKTHSPKTQCNFLHPPSYPPISPSSPHS